MGGNTSGLQSVEFLDHPADIQMHCTADSLAGLYEAAVRGMVGYAVRVPMAGPGRPGRVELSAGSNEMNMVGLLTHFIDLMYGEGLVAVQTSVSLEGGRLTCSYTAADASACLGLCEIKAVTLCGLQIFEEDGVFHSYCVFDV